MERAVRFVAYVASLLVIVGFAAFAVDQLQAASKRTQDELAGITSANPTRQQERNREQEHGAVRELIDDANDVLLAPVAWMADGWGNRWVRRAVPTALALLLYGFGLGMLARFSHGTAHRTHPRPTPV